MENVNTTRSNLGDRVSMNTGTMIYSAPKRASLVAVADGRDPFDYTPKEQPEVKKPAPKKDNTIFWIAGIVAIILLARKFM